MTRAQTKLYWREWHAARSACPEADRHGLHVSALGYDASSSELTNDELDKVLGEFRSLSRPADLISQIRQLKQPKTRLIWRINQLAPVAYLHAIMRDRFGHERGLEDLSVEELTQLRNTLCARNVKNGVAEEAESV